MTTSHGGGPDGIRDTDDEQPEHDNPGQDNPQTANADEDQTAPTQRPPEDGTAATGTTDG